jgi:hypothetical protein
MKNQTLFAAAMLVAASISSAALAGSDIWYVTPEDQGDCGDECYTPPTAWIDQINGDHAFGVTCGGTLILGGPAMEVSELPFSKAFLIVDNRSLGRFSVDSGLNDVYVSPDQGNDVSKAKIQSALNSGQALKLNVAGRSPIRFNLAGSRSAIRLMNRACQQ